MLALLLSFLMISRVLVSKFIAKRDRHVPVSEVRYDAVAVIIDVVVVVAAVVVVNSIEGITVHLKVREREKKTLAFPSRGQAQPPLSSSTHHEDTI